MGWPGHDGEVYEFICGCVIKSSRTAFGGYWWTHFISPIFKVATCKLHRLSQVPYLHTDVSFLWSQGSLNQQQDSTVVYSQHDIKRKHDWLYLPLPYLGLSLLCKEDKKKNVNKHNLAPTCLLCTVVSSMITSTRITWLPKSSCKASEVPGLAALWNAHWCSNPTMLFTTMMSDTGHAPSRNWTQP